MQQVQSYALLQRRPSAATLVPTLIFYIFLLLFEYLLLLLVFGRPTHKLECRAPVPAAPLALTDGTGLSVLQVELAENLRLAELGDAAAQFRVAFAFLLGQGTAHNKAKAKSWF